MNSKKRKLTYYAAVLLPYLAVGAGLYFFDSAWYALAGYHLIMLSGLVLVRRPARSSKPNWNTSVRLIVAATLLCSLLAGGVLSSLWPWLAKLPPNALKPFLLTWGLTARGWYGIIWYFCLVNPWLEEAYWRGWLSDLSDREWETAGWFAGYHGLVLLPLLHWWWIAPALLLLSITGWWWYRLTKIGSGLAGPIVCHIVGDVSIMLAMTGIIATSS